MTPGTTKRIEFIEGTEADLPKSGTRLTDAELAPINEIIKSTFSAPFLDNRRVSLVT